jgi:hypothetical protein
MYSSQITVSSTADTPVVCQSSTKHALIYEDPGIANWPTTDYLIKMPDSAAYIRKPAGTTFELSGVFNPGSLLCYLKAVTGSTTFDLAEVG